MDSIKCASACAVAILAAGCAPLDVAVIDNEGMVQIEEWQHSPIGLAGFAQGPMPPGLDNRRSEFKARLYVNTNGTVKKATFLEGSKGKWDKWRSVVMGFKFTPNPEALPGPWELDMLIKVRPLSEAMLDVPPEAQELVPARTSGGKPTASYRPVAYRTAPVR